MNEEVAELIDYQQLYDKLKAKFGSEIFGLWDYSSELPRCARGDPWQSIYVLKDLNRLEIVVGSSKFGGMSVTTFMPQDEFRML